MKTIVEPFRIRTVEPLRITTTDERRRAIERAHWNLFGLRARDVIIDLLTDSGTGAMSTTQWAALMAGDESYAGSDSFFDLEETVRDLMGFEHVIPVHQGRAAERILFQLLVEPGTTVPNNSHFDTTRANIEFLGAAAVDLLAEAGLDPASEDRFKGDMDADELRSFVSDAPEALCSEGRVPLGLLTITNNTNGGQPVSMANISEVAAIYHEHGIPFFLDAARFAENAYMIKLHEPGYEDVPLADIVREMFSHADGCMVSAKKDGLVNIGGLLCMNDGELADRAKALLVLTEGFPTYGGLAGRDMAALAQGLREVLDEDYLAYRHASSCYMSSRLEDLGVPTVRPAGLHAVYVDARQLLPQVPPEHLPGQALCCELYVIGGIRAVEIGTLMFGGTDSSSGLPTPAPLDLVRLTFPRRVYTQSHFDWVLEAFEQFVQRKDELRGYRILKEPEYLRAFTAQLEPLT